MKVLTAAIMGFLLVLASGCASKGETEEDTPEKEYYERAKRAMETRNFIRATEYLEKIEVNYPFGKYAEQAQQDLIYTRFMTDNYQGSRAAAQRFIRLHPQHPNVDYAYYMRGLSAYHADINQLTVFLPVDYTSRDPGQARVAFDDFSQFLVRFPDSKYAVDAQARMVSIRNRLAKYELHAARYYIRREAFVAALNRARYVTENLQETPAVADALALMVECYQVLGLEKQAEDALVVLAANYPDHRSFDRNMKFVGGEIRKQNRSLLHVVTFGLLG